MHTGSRERGTYEPAFFRRMVPKVESLFAAHLATETSPIESAPGLTYCPAKPSNTNPTGQPSTEQNLRVPTNTADSRALARFKFTALYFTTATRRHADRPRLGRQRMGGSQWCPTASDARAKHNKAVRTGVTPRGAGGPHALDRRRSPRSAAFPRHRAGGHHWDPPVRWRGGAAFKTRPLYFSQADWRASR